MTQDVNIVGVDGRRAPDWATQKTLDDILKHLQTHKGISESTAKALVSAVNNMSSNTEEAAEELANVADGVANLSGDSSDTGPKGNKEDGEKTKKQMGVFRSSLRGLTSDAADLSKNLLRNITGFESSSRYLYGFNRAVEKATDNTGKLGKALGFSLMGIVGVITSSFGMLVKVIMDHANVMLRMNEVGLRQITTISQLNTNLDELAMTSEQFQNIMIKFSTAMGTFGEDSLADLIGRSTEYNKELAKLGLTTADAAEFAGEYLQQQRLAGLFETMDDRRRRSAFNENLRQLSAFSTMMNVSRQDIARAQTDMLSQDRIRAVLLTRGSEETVDSIRAISGFFAGFGESGKAVNNMFADMVSVADPTMALENYNIALTAAPRAMSGFMDTVRQTRAGLLNENTALERSIQFNMDLADEADRLSLIASLTGDRATIELAAQAMSHRELIRRLGAENKTRDEIQAALMKRAKADKRAAATSALFQDTLTGLRRTFEGFVVGVFSSMAGGEENIDEAFESVMKTVSKFGNQLGDWIKSFLKENESENFMGLMGNLFSSVFDLLAAQAEKHVPRLVEIVISSIITSIPSLIGKVFRWLFDWVVRGAINDYRNIRNFFSRRRRTDTDSEGGEGTGETPEERGATTDPQASSMWQRMTRIQTPLATTVQSSEENRQKIADAAVSIDRTNQDMKQKTTETNEELARNTRTNSELLPVMTSLNSFLEKIDTNTRTANDLLSKMV